MKHVLSDQMFSHFCQSTLFRSQKNRPHPVVSVLTMKVNRVTRDISSALCSFPRLVSVPSLCLVGMEGFHLALVWLRGVSVPCRAV